MSYSVNCSECGKRFDVTPSRYKNRSNFFCGRSCESIYKSRTLSTKIVFSKISAKETILCKKKNRVSKIDLLKAMYGRLEKVNFFRKR